MTYSQLVPIAEFVWVAWADISSSFAVVDTGHVQLKIKLSGTYPTIKLAESEKVLEFISTLPQPATRRWVREDTNTMPSKEVGAWGTESFVISSHAVHSVMYATSSDTSWGA
eukprot:GHVU01063787.1.p2 GENE.GHVU01063787.1~~GHVU01063787.1.p2  ORF type:complete len:112 (+),score=6.87 GHVU01063787.1:1477-1812(+)